MAKKSVVARNVQRKKSVNRYFAKRQELKKIIADMSQTFEVREQAMRKLWALPRNANPIRVRNRCAETGRPRGVFKKFGLCRHKIRDFARHGLIPGLLKSSW
jgi:small subunit ribosomal protein S14